MNRTDVNKTTKENTITFRPAIRNDVYSIVEMLADDVLGMKREQFEDPLPETYYHAFKAIETDPNNELLVAERSGEVIAVLQLTIIPNLTYRGSRRAQIEGVRVSTSLRGEGIGRKLVQAAIEKAKDKECRMIQLTTDKQRPKAHLFYESLGFKATHEGMKLHLD